VEAVEKQEDDVWLDGLRFEKQADFEPGVTELWMMRLQNQQKN